MIDLARCMGGGVDYVPRQQEMPQQGYSFRNLPWGVAFSRPFEREILSVIKQCLMPDIDTIL